MSKSKMKGYIELILNSFASIDIQRLRYYLKDEHSYQETTKDIFLNQLEIIFKDHKASGDTEFTIYKGACTSTTCNNCGKSGYRFIGNHTRKYLNLIFIETDNDIKDIFNCAGFSTIEESGELDSAISLIIYKDDEISFHKTPEYLIKVNSALNAYKQIITTPPFILDYEQMCYWLDKHFYTDESISVDVFSPLMKWTSFKRLYSELTELREYVITHIAEIIVANKSIDSIKNKEDLISWLLKYESLYNSVPIIFIAAFKEGEQYIQDSIEPVIFSGTHFLSTFKFMENYSDHNDNLLNKYSD